MPHKLALLLAMAALMMTAGCGTLDCAHMGPFPKTPLLPPQGILFSQFKAPLTLNYHATAVNPGKVGTATTHYVALFYPMLSVSVMDPASVETAARNGGIKNVEYADYEVMQILGIYSRFTITAYGE